MLRFKTVSHGRGMTRWMQTFQSAHGNAQWRKQGVGRGSHVSILFTGFGQGAAGFLGYPKVGEGNYKKILVCAQSSELLYSKCLNHGQPTTEIF